MHSHKDSSATTKGLSLRKFITEKRSPTYNLTSSKKNSASYTEYSNETVNDLSTTTSTPSSQPDQRQTLTTLGRTKISIPQTEATAPLDLSLYINRIYGPQHFVTTKQPDGTFHIYRNIRIGEIPGIQYNLNRNRFEPRDVHLDFEYLRSALEEYQFRDIFDVFEEDPEIPRIPEESFFTPPESPQPETPRPRVRELPSERSIPQHRTLTPSKSALKVKLAQ